MLSKEELDAFGAASEAAGKGQKRPRSPPRLADIDIPRLTPNPERRRKMQRSRLNAEYNRMSGEELDDFSKDLGAYLMLTGKNLLNDPSSPVPFSEIKREYRRLSLMYHPDKYKKGNKNFEEDAATNQHVNITPEEFRELQTMDMIELNDAMERVQKLYEEKGWSQREAIAQQARLFRQHFLAKRKDGKRK